MDKIIDFSDYEFDKYYHKLIAFCNYRERCHYEVRLKLKEIKVDEIQSDNIISKLIEEGYLNEERYTRSFIRGKFKINKWGKNKIKVELKRKHIPPMLIQSCMSEIDENDYASAIFDLVEKKISNTKNLENKNLRFELKNYIIAKGYEPEVVSESIDNYFKNKNTE